MLEGGVHVDGVLAQGVSRQFGWGLGEVNLCGGGKKGPLAVHI